MPQTERRAPWTSQPPRGADLARPPRTAAVPHSDRSPLEQVQRDRASEEPQTRVLADIWQAIDSMGLLAQDADDRGLFKIARQIRRRARQLTRLVILSRRADASTGSPAEWALTSDDIESTL